MMIIGIVTVNKTRSARTSGSIKPCGNRPYLSMIYDPNITLMNMPAQISAMLYEAAALGLPGYNHAQAIAK